MFFEHFDLSVPQSISFATISPSIIVYENPRAVFWFSTVQFDLILLYNIATIRVELI